MSFDIGRNLYLLTFTTGLPSIPLLFLLGISLWLYILDASLLEHFYDVSTSRTKFQTGCVSVFSIFFIALGSKRLQRSYSQHRYSDKGLTKV